jgi:hypothetical protein
MLKEKIQLALGVILILMPWVFGFSYDSVMKWTNTLVGLAITLINLWAIFGTPKTPVIEDKTTESKRTRPSRF